MKKAIAFICALFMYITCAHAQSVEQCVENYNNYLRLYPQERVYLHFDNSTYYKGEHIWYKANIVRGDNLKKTDVSKVLYVELVSPIGIPLAVQKLTVENGQAAGSFLLTDSIRSGFYEVRAYTSWMLNFAWGERHAWKSLNNKRNKDYYGSDFINYLQSNAGIFSRVFPVYERRGVGTHVMTRVEAPNNTPKKLIMCFYPEGGNLIDGIETKVAFEVKTSDGEAVNVKGSLKSGKTELCKVTTIHNGRGVFKLTPKVKMNGKIFVETTCNEKNLKFYLPEIQSKGIALAVDNGSDVNIKVCRSDETPAADLGLIVTCRGVTKTFKRIDLREKLSTHIHINKQDLATGVNIVTLFGDGGKVVGQREIFVNNGMGQCGITCLTPAKEYKPYEKVALDFGINQADGAETFSLSVTDGEEKGYYTGNVFTDLLLSSEVKGFIPDVAYYFLKDDEAHRQALDLLLMVQGWNRYDYAEMMTATSPQFRYEREQGIAFRGKVMDTNYQGDIIYNKNDDDDLRWWTPDHPVYNRHSDVGFGPQSSWQQPKKTLTLKLTSVSSDQDIAKTLTINTDGKFSINFPDGYGKTYYSLLVSDDDNPRHIVNNRYLVVPQNAVSPLPKRYDYYETHLPQTGIEYEQKSFLALPPININIPDVMTYLSGVRGRIENFEIGNNSDVVPEHLIMPLLGMAGGFTISVNGYKDALLSEDHYILLPEVRERLASADQELLPPSSSFKTMQIYICADSRNGIYTPQKREEYKLKTEGMRTPPRVVHLNYVTDGTKINNQGANGYKTVIYGYSQPATFYSPDYSRQPLPKQTDCRRTIYWNPNVTTNGDGKAHVEFYNNGNANKLHISAEGVSHNGVPMTL